MSGKEHMTIGTSASIGLVIGLIALGNMSINFNMILLIFGAVAGSYMPDIDSHKSTASQAFNKILMFIIIIAALFYILGIQFNTTYIYSINKFLKLNYKGVILFSILTVLGKLSPHRMFTHKWLGTLAFCYSAALMVNDYLALGFTLGYILHIIADRITKNGKYLRFFQFKLPMKNSKDKFTISW
ncbi:metal-dependent hydrolase [uncultured Clostridium sp.]|uniref:metal-dependent hydrolase n=1 Tax=uncultured Clostridium sp. TaxID=59620 RepID=UPI0025F66409|nr:metal-dependent hydrolase [uncultured Clostridium sp.]